MTYLENADYDWMELLNFHERPFRAKLIPSKVWVDLDTYRNDQVGLGNYVKKYTREGILTSKSFVRFK
jgi:hypothetical protein